MSDGETRKGKVRRRWKEWRIANHDRHLAYSRKWYSENKDRAKESMRKWNRKNIVRSRELKRLWRQKNRERHNSSNRQWAKNNPVKIRSKTVWRRAMLHRATVTGTQKAIEAIYCRAMELRKWFNVCVDHIIPLAKGGLHCPSNLQIIYHSENCAKGDRLNYVPTVIFL